MIQNKECKINQWVSSIADQTIERWKRNWQNNADLGGINITIPDNQFFRLQNCFWFQTTELIFRKNLKFWQVWIQDLTLSILALPDRSLGQFHTRSL